MKLNHEGVHPCGDRGAFDSEEAEVSSSNPSSKQPRAREQRDQAPLLHAGLLPLKLLER